MACVTVCPTQAIKVDEANLEVHKTTAAEITSLTSHLVLFLIILVEVIFN
jgi:ferredoxin